MRSPLVCVVCLLLSVAACGPSRDAMHDDARAGRVQAGAPLHAHQKVVVAASRETVWGVLTDIARWSEWQPQLSQITAPSSLSADQDFTWTNDGNVIHSRLALVEPPARLAWTGEVSVAKAIHLWRLEESGPTATTVEVEETMDGFLLTWFYGQQDLDKDVARSLEALRQASESAASRAPR